MLHILYMSALCVRTFYSLLFGCLCVHNNTLLNTGWVGPPPALLLHEKLLNWKVQKWLDWLKFEDGRVVVIGWDDLADRSADNNLKWWKKNSKTCWLQTSRSMCSRNSCFNEKSNKKYIQLKMKRTCSVRMKNHLLWRWEKKYPHRWISAGLIKMTSPAVKHHFDLRRSKNQ